MKNIPVVIFGHHQMKYKLNNNTKRLCFEQYVIDGTEEKKMFRLQVNQGNSKYVIMGETHQLDEETLQIIVEGGRKYTGINEFLYLDVMTREKEQEEQEIKASKG